jgi:tetratricopeptide (TPR) repeat protein
MKDPVKYDSRNREMSMAKLIFMVIAWLVVLVPFSAAQVSPSPRAAFQVPITYIRAYSAIYPDFFKEVELESEQDRGVTYLDEIEKRKYILTAEEAYNRTINYTRYIYDKTPDTEGEWLALAVYYLGDYRYEDDYQKAEEATKRALEINPNSFEAYAILFYIYDWYPQMGNSVQVLEKMETLAKSAKHYGLLGSIYSGGETNPFSNPARSKYFYEMALREDPWYAPAYAGLAAYYHNAGDYPKAIGYLERFLELRPNDSWALSLLQEYSGIYPPIGKRDPFELVMAGLAVLFVLNMIRIAWKRKKTKRTS